MISSSDLLNQLQNNTNQVNYANSRKNVGSGKLDREGFIQLMLAQLQYQDPMEPQDNTQMLTQQLMLEQSDQMNDLVNASKFSQAASMVGQVATLVDAPWDFTNNVSSTPAWDVKTNLPKVVTGTIEGVQFDSTLGKALIKINGKYYDSESIQQISNPTPTTSSEVNNSSS